MDTRNIIASAYCQLGNGTFRANNPETDLALDGDFRNATAHCVDMALKAAQEAQLALKQINKDQKAGFLRTIALEVEVMGPELIERARAESGLPAARLQGEIARTTSQLRLFASLVEEGSWVNATIDRAQPERVPLPKPDIRRMVVGIGPIVVFGASNFPLAFSVAGGDTASAFAAGCPVIVKVHPAHPGTSALVGQAISAAVKKTAMPPGIFSMLYDEGHEIGTTLVLHPAVKAIAFTGSLKGGLALLDISRQRKEPVPVFAEMGSINPVLFLPQALENDAETLATKYAASITMGAGQFCTNPGLLLAIRSAGLDRFTDALAGILQQAPSATMLSKGIWKNYTDSSAKALKEPHVELLVSSEQLNNDISNQSVATLARVSATDFINNPNLQHEVFGPFSLLVVADDMKQIEEVTRSLGGQLTLSVMAGEKDLVNYHEIIGTLSDLAGRLVMNNVPTGVEVCAAMQHGGPFPASTDSRFTSVGTAAIYRFTRPVAWQDWADALLPDELKNGNPLNIFRLIDQKWTKE